MSGMCKAGALGFTLPDGPASVVARQLSNDGHDVGPTTIKDHRAGRCSCHLAGARITAGTARILTVDIERLPGMAQVPFWDLSDYKNRRLPRGHRGGVAPHHLRRLALVRGQAGAVRC